MCACRLQGVAKNFKEIFEALAPGGTGQLVMLKRGLPDAEPDAEAGEDGERPPAPASERYKGVRVKVRVLCGRCSNGEFQEPLVQMTR